MINKRMCQRSEVAARAMAPVVLVAMLVVAGCVSPPGPFVPKSAAAPPIVHCNDYTGHKDGSKPWVMGGACCCTPSDALMAQLQEDGHCMDMSGADLAKMYADKGVALRGSGHRACNGLCSSGPHVVLGGKCMCPPTPGTVYYERIVTREVRPVADSTN